MQGREIRVGLIGAGYIASWHAEAIAAVPGTRLVGVCDPATSAAQALAGAWGAQAYASLGDMLAKAQLDAVHVLTPPHLHAPQALEALAAGVHVFVEKPFALTQAEAAAMRDAAQRAGKTIAVNHNFLALPSYARLKELMAQGVPGRIDSADIRWRFPLAPVRSGPYGLWMLRTPGNLLLELGPHLFAFAQDLLGPLDDFDLRLSKPMGLPGGAELPQGWSIRARAGTADVTLNLSLVEGAEDRSVELRGVSGRVRLDFGADTLEVSRPNTSDIVINPLRAELALAGQHLREGFRNGWVQLSSLNQKSPYALGFRGAIAEFYRAVKAGVPVAERFSGASAVGVIQAIESTLALLPPSKPLPAPPTEVPAGKTMLVIGGTGFIGRALTRALVAAGHPVKVLSRSRQNPFADLGAAVEIVPVSLSDAQGMAQAMAGVDCVYHLAKAEEKSWAGYLKNDVEVTTSIAQAALSAGVRRLVYTGTIASYDASDPSKPITEDTDFGPMENRNLYARSKALCEERLKAMQRDKGLPLVIARPGIVVGPGGPLQHWGIGRWHGAGGVRIWGDGHNLLPFVLNDDVADALVRMAQVPGIEGQSFNLIGEPMMTARDYFDAIHKLTGTRITVARGNLFLAYLGDATKYTLKRFALGKKGLRKPLLIDWKSRAHNSPFRNARAKAVLGWRPEADVQRFASKAVAHQSLFGF